MWLKNKTAIITGSASGIGRATAERFSEEGASVVCVDVDLEGAEQTATAITDGGGKAEALRCDVSDYAATASVIDHVVKHFGRLDILCNIAGIGHLKFDSDETPESWNHVISVNLTGTFYMCQHALPHLLRSKGAIVNCSSTAGTRGAPWSAAYSASKGGVCALTRSLAISHGKQGLRVNCVVPGPVKTPIVNSFMPPEGHDRSLFSFLKAFGRVGEPSELASAFVFLASDHASYINGVNLRVDGGVKT